VTVQDRLTRLARSDTVLPEEGRHDVVVRDDRVALAVDAGTSDRRVDADLRDRQLPVGTSPGYCSERSRRAKGLVAPAALLVTCCRSTPP
jgi:hypothetical protein